MKRPSHRERPPPLKINRPGHQNDAPVANLYNTGGMNNAMVHRPQPHQYRQPVIIQTKSPDVINTDPRDFMAMVQKLTGQARGHIHSPLPKRPRLPSSFNGASHPAYTNNHAFASAENRAGSDVSGRGPNSHNLMSQAQNTQRDVQLGAADFPNTNLSSSSPQGRNARRPPLGLGIGFPANSAAGPGRKDKLNLGLRLGIQQRDHASLSQSASSLLSPSNFVLSPSLLPSPSTFLNDFPFLKSPPLASLSPSFATYNSGAGLLPSPKLAMEAGGLYDSLRSPKLEFPSEFDPKQDSLIRSPKLGFPNSNSKLGMEAAEGGDHHHHHSLQRSPSSVGFPNYSPGPLTKCLADLPVLSPAAYKWIENNPFAADAIMSPLPHLSRSHGLPPRPPPSYRSDHFL